MPDHDAVVIGSGPNGLAAANLLVDHGWDVLVLEAQPTPGGAVASDHGVHPDFTHDTFSSFYPMAGVSPVFRRLDLERHGLEWTHAPAVIGNPLPDGSWAMVHRSAADTVAALEAQTPGDGEPWLELVHAWNRIGPELCDGLMGPLLPVRAVLRGLPKLRSVGGGQFIRTLLEPVTTLVEQRFRGPAARLLLGGSAAHTDLPLAASGSGLYAFVLTMIAQTTGFGVPRGGAAELTAALLRRLAERGGQVRTDARVSEVLLDGHRARGVCTAEGELITSRAVIAGVAVTSLYGELISPDRLTPRIRRGMAGFEQDPATIKVDWALSGPVPWANPPEAAPGTLHVSDSLDQLGLAQAAITHHRIPAAPFLLAGQMTTADPARSPTGTEALWAYTHVPQVVHADEGPDGLTGEWDASELERMADRVQARIRAYAPDFDSVVISRRVLGPRQLQDRNANLVNGALGGGTSGLHQQLVFRPTPGLGRAETPYRGLFLGSASAHPGGGVHGACGANAARAAVFAARLGRI